MIFRVAYNAVEHDEIFLERFLCYNYFRFFHNGKFERTNIENIVQSYMASVRFSFFFHTIIKLLW